MLDPKKDSPPEQEPGGEVREPMEAPEGSSGAGSRRVLLLVLLLVVVAGGGFYFRFIAGEPEPPSPARQGVVSQPITMPVPPPPPVEKSDEAAAEPEAVATAGDAEEPSAPSAAQARPEPEPAANVPAAAAEPPKPAFALQAGPFTSTGELAEAERALRSLGYEPSRGSAPQTLTLTRLLLGVYSSAESMPRLREAQALIPDAFPLRRGDDVAIYAGSFRDLDRARLFADVLYEQGVAVEEEQAEVVLEADVLVFGTFAEEDEAARALQSVRNAGLESRLLPLQ